MRCTLGFFTKMSFEYSNPRELDLNAVDRALLCTTFRIF